MENVKSCCGASGARAGVAAALAGVASMVLLAVQAAVAGGQPAGHGNMPLPERVQGIDVVVSIAPLEGLVRPLLPRGSRVDVLIPPGVSEHGYEIPPGKLAAMAKADVVVYIGMGLEPAVEKFLKEHGREERRVVRVAEALGVGEGHEHHHHHDHDHAHGEECDHGHGDPHVWLDPVLMEKLVPVLARTVEKAMKHKGLHNAETGAALAAAQERLAERVRAVDASYRAELEKLERKKIVVAHDAYGWMAKRYGLTVRALTGLGAGEPTPGAIRDAVAAIREDGVKAVYVEPQLSQVAGRRVASAAGVKVLVLDPLGNGDWFGMMERNLAALREGLRD